MLTTSSILLSNQQSVNELSTIRHTPLRSPIVARTPILNDISLSPANNLPGYSARCSYAPSRPRLAPSYEMTGVRIDYDDNHPYQVDADQGKYSSETRMDLAPTSPSRYYSSCFWASKSLDVFAVREEFPPQENLLPPFSYRHSSSLYRWNDPVHVRFCLSNRVT